MGAINVVPATLEHGRTVAATMRPCDAAEVWALGRYSPLEAVTASLQTPGEHWAYVVEGRPLAVFGCSYAPDVPFGSPWLLAGVDAQPYARPLLRDGRGLVARWVHQCGRLYNLVDARNTTSIRWLARLGFTFDVPVPAGPDAVLFVPFWMTR